MSRYIILNSSRICRWSVAAVAFIFAVSFSFFEKMLPIECFHSVLIKKIISILMIYVTLTLAVQLSKREKDIIKYIGEHAFTIYIYSWPIQAVTEMVAVIILKLEWYVVFICMFFAGLLGPCMIYEIYMKKDKKSQFLDQMIGVK